MPYHSRHEQMKSCETGHEQIPRYGLVGVGVQEGHSLCYVLAAQHTLSHSFNHTTALTVVRSGLLFRKILCLKTNRIENHTNKHCTRISQDLQPN